MLEHQCGLARAFRSFDADESVSPVDFLEQVSFEVGRGGLKFPVQDLLQIFNCVHGVSILTTLK